MSAAFLQKLGATAVAFLVMGLGFRYVFPVLLPFLTGGLIALAAEPLVRLCAGRGRVPRAVAAGLGVTLTLLMLLGLLSIIGALLVKELGSLAGVMPGLEDTARQGVQLLEDFLLDTAHSLPEGVRPVLEKTVTELFDDGTALMDQVSARIPGAISSVLGWVPSGALSIGTGLISAFMISARLPKLKAAARARLPQSWNSKYRPALKRMRKTLALWLKAQGKLALLTYGIATVGLALLGVKHAPLWALLVALVDAVPMLGSGTVLIPWALISLLQQEHFRAIGLLCVYGAAFLSRSILEPRIVGKQLGLDPLVTLFALYAGFRFFGLPGLLLAPFLAAAVKTVTQSK